MPESKLSAAGPPISITCDICSREMRLVTVIPMLDDTTYTYACANGHRYQIVTADADDELV
jgi:hypothetical protein